MAPAEPAPEHSAAGSVPSTVRLRLDIAYDGTDFSGWAAQPGLRTVQGILEDSLSTVLRAPVQLTVAGRTDAGVHAEGQVAHLDTTLEALSGTGAQGRRSGAPDLDNLVHRLARFLPPDVRVQRISHAPKDFDARFSGVRRHYVYRLSTAPYGVAPLEARFRVAAKRNLDVAAMTAASRNLLGLHDFAAFCRRREGATTVRELQRYDWVLDGTRLDAYVSADAFCWSMVRSLVGAVLAVGEGRRPVAWASALLQQRERAGAVTVAPAHGLSLLGVDYPADADLAARNAATRDTRAPIPGCC